MSASKDPNEKRFAQYLAENRIFIVDTSSASRARLAKTLVDMGATTSKITMISNVETALSEMANLKPKVVLSDYYLGAQTGFDLLKAHREQIQPADDCLFVLITSNASQSAVAQAAEEDVDTFILKPYTIDSLRKSLLTGAIAKLFPSDYAKEIKRGKELMFKGDLKEALEIFENAKKMSKNPTLAFFYAGQTQKMMEALQQAKDSFEGGLGLNTIHFKCLVGLYDLLMVQNKIYEAYDIVTRIAKYFPANPDRLNQVLRLTVLTGNYDHIENYYEIFRAMEHRPDPMVRHMCAALLVSAKYQLRKEDTKRAIKLIDDMSISCAGRPQFLRKAVETLLEAGLKPEAKSQLARFPSQVQSEPDFLVCKYEVDSTEMVASNAMAIGRSLIDTGVKDPTVYKLLIKQLIEVKFIDNAHNIFAAAVADFPELAPELTEMFPADQRPAVSSPAGRAVAAPQAA